MWIGKQNKAFKFDSYAGQLLGLFWLRVSFRNLIHGWKEQPVVFSAGIFCDISELAGRVVVISV